MTLEYFLLLLMIEGMPGSVHGRPDTSVYSDH